MSVQLASVARVASCSRAIFLVERARELHRRELRRVQDLVRIGVADAAEEVRIGQRRASACGFSRVSAAENSASVAARGSMPPGSSLRSASSPRTSVSEARLRVPASVKIERAVAKWRSRHVFRPCRASRPAPPAQPPGDHEVDHDEELVVEAEDDALADAPHAFTVRAEDGVERRIVRAQHERR
jgi:hypothetical protein